MANETPAPQPQQQQQQTSPTVALFQKAHQRMVMLQRLDEQLAGIMEQRRRLSDELRGIQFQINEEFDKMMKAADEGPARILGQIAETGRNNGREPLSRIEVSESSSSSL
jgi:hypothetical protein